MRVSSPSVNPATKSKMLCGYRNKTPKLQVVRVSRSAKTELERVVFPWSWLLFETEPEAELEIYSDEPAAPSPTHRIACHDLKVNV